MHLAEKSAYSVRMEETLRTHLLELARLYTEASGVSASAVGRLALNDNTVFSRLEAAKIGFGVRTYDKLVRWFSLNWPEGAAWPDDIARPSASSRADEVAA